MTYAIKRKAIDGLLELVSIASMHMETPETPESIYPPALQLAPQVGYGYNRKPAKPPRGFDKWERPRQYAWEQKFFAKRDKVRKAWQAKLPAEEMKFSLGYGVTASRGKSLASRVRFLRPADQRQFDNLEAQITQLHKRRTALIGAAWKRGKIIKAKDLVAAKAAEKRTVSRYDRSERTRLNSTDEFMPPEQVAINRVRQAERDERDRIRRAAEQKRYEAERKAAAKLAARLQAAHTRGSHAKKPVDQCQACREAEWQRRDELRKSESARYQAEQAALQAAGVEADESTRFEAICADCGETITVTDEMAECPLCGGSSGYEAIDGGMDLEEEEAA